MYDAASIPRQPPALPVPPLNGRLSLGDTLRETALFQGLDERARHDLLAHAEARCYRRRELLFLEGDTSHDLVLLVAGLVILFRSRPDGRRATLAAVHPPGVLGEEVLAGQLTRTASAEALAESFALALPRSALTQVIRQHPAVGEAARRWLAERLTGMMEQRADDLLLDLPARVAKALLALAQRRARPPLVIDSSQGFVASLAGGSRQSVNQALQRFAGRGWLRIERARIVVADPEALMRRAGQNPGDCR